MYDSKPRKMKDIAIFHVHGGGFFSLSSFSYLTFTIPLAKECKIPVYSVDYDLCPEKKYPTQIN